MHASILLKPADDLGRDTGHDRICRYIFGDHCACRDHGVFPDGDTGKDCGIGSDPHVLSNVNRGWKQIMPLLGGQAMVQGSQHHIVPDQRPVLNDDPALVLEPAPAVEKTPLPTVMFFPQSV